MSNPVCSTCGEPNDRVPQRYCRSCHAAYMRDFRFRTPLTPEQRRKMNSRSYANSYQRRGKLIPEPCAVCGSEDAQKHHPDYDRPLYVVWLCRNCHLWIHERGAA